ncbi:hypothetical protein N9W34_05880 [Rickettsiales bacterium]|nr:hypothetical protein [Rickettsiales bacterium]
MAIDLNADLGTIIKGLMNKAVASQGGGEVGINKSLLKGPYKEAIIIGSVIVVVMTIYIFAVFIPIQTSNDNKRKELADTIEMQGELDLMDSQIKMLNKKYNSSKKHYEKTLSHFSESKDVDSLYEAISELAVTHSLVVSDIKEVAKKAAPVKKQKSTKNKKGKKGEKAKTPSPADEVEEINVDVTFNGRYGQYMKFRKDLATNKELLSIGSEIIEVGSNKEERGKISVKLTVTAYALNKKPYQKILEKNEKL